MPFSWLSRIKKAGQESPKPGCIIYIESLDLEVVASPEVEVSAVHTDT
jgi:hypothetical protein